MKDTLTVSSVTDKIFREQCAQMGIKYTCVGEGRDGDKYLIEFYSISDIYCLGQCVGMNALSQSMTQPGNAKS